MRSSLSIFSSQSGAATLSRSRIGRASMRKIQEDGRVRYSNATPHIAEYQRVSPFLGQGTQHRKAGEGGKLRSNRNTHARILKNGAAAIGVLQRSRETMTGAIGGQPLRESPLISQGDSQSVGVYPHMSPHWRIGFTARRPAGNMLMPDRCQTPEVPILQIPQMPLPPTPQRPAIASIPASGRSNVARMWQTLA